MTLVGLRVVRGPNWKWGNQDGGVGGVGTVVSSFTDDSNDSLGARLMSLRQKNVTHLVVVVWDSGKKEGYRAGFKGAYDLRILDNAALGVKHIGVRCQGTNCQVAEILGFRWQCAVCDANLCSKCFFQIDKHHDTTHVAFRRYETPTAKPVDFVFDEQRKVSMKGMFFGAKVKRGKDWTYGNEDNDQIGQVIKAPKPEMGKVQVQWGTSSPYSFPYRRGLDGKMDLKVIQAAIGGSYDPESLPVLGAGSPSTRANDFFVGDRVRVKATLEEFRSKQIGHGGWNPLMETCLGVVGVVCSTNDKRILVEYKGLEKKWHINSELLERMSPFSINQPVRILNNEATFKAMQESLGNPIACSMRGQRGRVTQIHEDGRVDLELMNPVKESINLQSEWIENLIMSQEIYQKLIKLKSKISQLLVEAAFEGDLYVIEDLVNNQKAPIDAGDPSKDGVTALHMACRTGQVDIVHWLLDHGSELEKEDDKGRRAIHHAVKGCQPGVLKMLIEVQGVDLNSLTKKNLTALQKAVEKQDIECIQILIENHCKVDLPDKDGDTPLHNAVRLTKTNMFLPNDVPPVIDALVKSGRVNFKLRNNRGLNVLHMAVVSENLQAVQYLLQVAGDDLAAEETSDDQASTALHYACFRRNFQIAKLLVEHLKKMEDQQRMEVEESQPSTSTATAEQQESASKQKASSFLNPKTKKGLTPLMLACYHGHHALVELLVEAGADVHAVDQDGDNAIICTSMKIKKKLGDEIKQGTFPTEELSPKIYQLFEEYKDEYKDSMGKYPWLAIMCYLIQHGANLMTVNKRGKTVCDIVEDPLITTFLEHFALPFQASASSTDNGGGAVAPVNFHQTTSNGIGNGGEVTMCILCTNPSSHHDFKDCGHWTNLTCTACSARLLRCVDCKLATSFNQLHLNPQQSEANVIGRSTQQSYEKDGMSFDEFFPDFFPASEQPTTSGFSTHGQHNDDGQNIIELLDGSRQNQPQPQQPSYGDGPFYPAVSYPIQNYGQHAQPNMQYYQPAYQQQPFNHQCGPQTNNPGAVASGQRYHPYNSQARPIDFQQHANHQPFNRQQNYGQEQFNQHGPQTNNPGSEVSHTTFNGQAIPNNFQQQHANHQPFNQQQHYGQEQFNQNGPLPNNPGSVASHTTFNGQAIPSDIQQPANHQPVCQQQNFGHQEWKVLPAGNRTANAPQLRDPLGNTYGLLRKKKDGTEVWQCTKKGLTTSKCPAKAFKPLNGAYELGKVSHCHHDNNSSKQ